MLSLTRREEIGRDCTVHLIVAAKIGDRKAVSLLIDRGADINAIARVGSVETALIAAASWSQQDVVQLLLDRGADTNINVHKNYGTALIAAAAGGKWDIVQLLLDRGADINITADNDYGTALIAAIVNNRRDIVELLLDRGADINITADNDYGTALIAAILHGRRDILQLLLGRGADINTIAGVGETGTALIAAAAIGDRNSVHLLLGLGADINITAGEYGTALIVAILGDRRDILQLLLDGGADINTIAGVGEYGTPLIAAAANGKLDSVHLLLDRGADINITAGKYGTALIAAIMRDRRDILQLLLDRGADINISAGKYGTALIAAIMRDRRDILQLLLDRGADINISAGKYGTALIAAILSDRRDILQLLLDRGADINTIAGVGEYGTALIAALANCARDSVYLLLGRGADINTIAVAGVSKYGTALIAAAANGDRDSVHLLLDRGADINTIAGVGEYGTALIAAAANGERGSMEVLLGRGADINTITGAGKYGTALIAAIAKGRLGVMSLLLDKGADVNAVVYVNSGNFEHGSALNAALFISIDIDNEILSLLFSHRVDAVDINIVADDHGTALGRATYNGDEGKVSYLLERGADVFHVGGKYETPQGEYPTALDAARAGGKAGPGLLAQLTSAMSICVQNGETDPPSRSCPPFPMPYTSSMKAPRTQVTSIHLESIWKLHAGDNLTLEQADLACEALGTEVLVKVLVALVGIDTEAAQSHQVWIRNDVRYFVNQTYDLGLAYAASRVAWKDFNQQAFSVAVHRSRWLKKAEEIDAARGSAIYWDAGTGQGLIKSPYEIMPRRIWDVKSNRVVDFRMLHSDALARECREPKNCSPTFEFWAVTHSWTRIMDPIDTTINQYQWPVPLPQNLDLDRDLRKELLDFGAEYVWLDVLCLRQHFKDHSVSTTQIFNNSRFLERTRDTTRADEWKLDVPTIGNIYRAATRLVRYFNGLGRPFSNEGWDDDRHWLRRAWTLQEIKSENTTLNGGIAHDSTSASILMNAKGIVAGELSTLRRAIRTVVKLAAEVDSGTGCSVYDLAREMAKRRATQPTDKVAGLLYLLRITELPTYDETISDEVAWTQCFHMLPLERKIEILCDFPYRGNDRQWFPGWKQLLDWPQRDPEYEHARSVWPQEQQPGSLGDLVYLCLPGVWAISNVHLRPSEPNQYEIEIGKRIFGFYCPYLDQTPIDLGVSSRFTLATVSLRNSNNWVVCEALERQRSADEVVEIEVLKKVGVLATDSCSELFVRAGRSDSMLRKIHAKFV